MTTDRLTAEYGGVLMFRDDVARSGYKVRNCATLWQWVRFWIGDQPVDGDIQFTGRPIEYAP